MRALRAADAAVRAEAAWWLAEYAPGDRAARPDPAAELREVIAHERDPAAAVAEVAALSMITRGTHERTVRLLEVLGHGLVPAEAQRLAAYGLASEIPEDQLHELLVRAAPTGPFETPVGRMIVEGLAARPGPVLSAALQATRGSPARRAVVTRALGRHGDPRWSGVIIESLGAPARPATEALSAASIEAAATLRLTEAAPRLVAIVDDRDAGRLRALALRALGSLGGSYDVAVIARASDDPTLRVHALEAAAALGDPSLEGACARWLDAPVARDRVAAARCLAGIGNDASRALLRARGASETDAGVREVLDAALAAGSPRDRRSTAALVRALGGAAPTWSRVRVAGALSARAREGDELASGALAALVAREAEEPSLVAIAALRGAVLAEAALDDELLCAWLRAGDPLARQAAAHAVGIAGGRASRALLRARVLREPDDEARRAMIIALGRDDHDAAPARLELVAQTAFSEGQLVALTHARRLLRGGAPPRPFVASISLRRRGIEAHSVWSITLPDGGLALGAAGDDGALELPEAGPAGAAPRRVDGR